MLLVESTFGIASDGVAFRPPANEDRPNSMPDTDSLMASYYELRDRVIRERDAGNLFEALRFSDRALSMATATGDQDLIDQAYCNRCGFAVVLGHSDVSTSRLREILMRNRSLTISYAAAYVLSYVHSAEKNYKKSLFYAQISHHRAYAIGDIELMVQSHNEIGRCYLSESYLDKAVNECETALRLLPQELSIPHMAPMINLGYTKILLKDYRTGFEHLYRSLRHCRSHSSESAYREWIHLYLCFGYIEMRRWRYAWHHGCQSLALAERNKNPDVVKNSLYLLGELEKSVGDLEAAHDYFLRLQREFYPDNEDLPKVMLCCDTRDLVNLRA